MADTYELGPAPRHQCLIYQGPPSRPLPRLARMLRDKLAANYRCVYLNSPSMVGSMHSELAAIGVDVESELEEGSLVLSSHLDHLTDNRWFNVDRMLRGLEDTLEAALKNQYVGLWATGDMAWEFGPEQGFMKLLEYEWRLQELFRAHPQLEGICQYHIDTLPDVAVREGLLAHPGVLLDQTRSGANPHYIRPENFSDDERHNPGLNRFIQHLCTTAEAGGLDKLILDLTNAA